MGAILCVRVCGAGLDFVFYQKKKKECGAFPSSVRFIWCCGGFIGSWGEERDAESVKEGPHPFFFLNASPCSLRLSGGRRGRALV